MIDDFDVKHIGFKLYKVVNEYQVSYTAKRGLDRLDRLDGLDDLKQLEKLGPYANDSQNTLNVENRFIMEPIENDVLKDILMSSIGSRNQKVNQNPKQQICVWNILNWITWEFWDGYVDKSDIRISNFNKWLREYYIHNDIIHIELLMNKINELLYEIEPQYLTFYSFIDLWKYRRNEDGNIILQIHFDDKVQLKEEIQNILMLYHLLFICYKRDIRYIRFI